MRIIRDYRCTSCDSISEHWVNEAELAALPCPECGETSLKPMIGAPKIATIMIATDGKASSDGMTTSIDKWHRMRAQKAKIEKRNLERHGTEQ